MRRVAYLVLGVLAVFWLADAAYMAVTAQWVTAFGALILAAVAFMFARRLRDGA